MNNDDIRRIDNSKFVDWVVTSAYEKTLLELQLDGVTPDEREQIRLRAAIAIGVSETVIKMKYLVDAHLDLESDG